MNCTVIAKSVQGASHLVHNTECQDSYRQVEFDDGCAIVAVADGHGSSSCPFSKSGSTIAVNTFIHIISELHDLYADIQIILNGSTLAYRRKKYWITMINSLETWR